MKRVDTTRLADLIARCFDLSMDGRLSQARRSALLAAGKRLRGDLVTLLAAQFDEQTAEVDAANEDLASVDDALQASAADLGKLGQTLQKITRLVGKIDGLIPMIAKNV
jgi:geranylgeranyl pyrophosphate synthase